MFIASIFALILAYLVKANDKMINKYQGKSTFVSWIFAGLGILYTLSPIDLIPDVPVIGWVDDFFVIATTLLNLCENELGKVSETLGAILRIFKWIFLVLGIIAVLLVVLLGTFIYKMIAS